MLENEFMDFHSPVFGKANFKRVCRLCGAKFVTCPTIVQEANDSNRSDKFFVSLKTTM